MHIFIYPSQDAYINNSSKYSSKNFGIDEILEIYASNLGKKTVYNNPVWHDAPLTASSYGNEGWLAYTTSSLFVYSGSKWYSFSLTSSLVPNSIFIANFSGRISNVTTDPKKPLLISGSATFASGSFSGSMNIISDTQFTGSWTTGSFSGSVMVGATFDKLIVNNVNYTSPLATTVIGTGSYDNLFGRLKGKSNTGIPCYTGQYYPITHLESGSYSGSFKSINYNGYISTITSSNVYYSDVLNFSGYIRGKYTGSFTVPSTTDYIISPELSRTLVKFDLTSISQSISKNEISSSNIKFILNLKACGLRNLPLDYTIYAYPISQSWQNGNGRYADDGSDYGISWNYREYLNNKSWYGSENVGIYPQVDYLKNSNYASASWQNQGGTWYYSVPASYSDKPKWICTSSAFPSLQNTSLICSQSFSYGQQSDIKMDITQIVRSWLCGCIPNEGLILLTSFEIDTPPLQNTNGLLQFFGKETNTIYSPYIDIAWDDSVFNTGSLSPVTGSIENLITLNYLKNSYKVGSVPKIFVFARDRYPLKQFNKAYQQPSAITPKYLPAESYYMIKDAESEEVLIDFGEYNKLSCDASKGNYFVLNTEGLPQERYLKIIIKSIYDDGTVDIVDTNKVFKITR